MHSSEMIKYRGFEDFSVTREISEIYKYTLNNILYENEGVAGKIAH